MKFFQPSVRFTSQKPRELYLFDKPIKSLYFRLVPLMNKPCFTVSKGVSMGLTISSITVNRNF